MATDWDARPDEPYAQITKAGRYMHHIVIHDGLMQVGPGGGAWFTFGAARAKRKARKVLASYLKSKQDRAAPTLITASDLRDAS
jgi:hypothetical protein